MDSCLNHLKSRANKALKCQNFITTRIMQNPSFYFKIEKKKRENEEREAYLASLDVQALSSHKEEDEEESSMLEGDQERKIIIQECMREVGMEQRRSFKRARKWFSRVTIAVIVSILSQTEN